MSSDAVFPAIKNELSLEYHRESRAWNLPDGRQFLTVDRIAATKNPRALRRICRVRIRELDLTPPAWL